ncbi:MAG: hypothetical protein M0C28_08720 [Candidatus Moduliflexus flocculans]|nr:hypothetical protein [Candidatus Moduliflexus flocculans]
MQDEELNKTEVSNTDQVCFRYRWSATSAKRKEGENDWRRKMRSPYLSLEEEKIFLKRKSSLLSARIYPLLVPESSPIVFCPSIPPEDKSYVKESTTNNYGLWKSKMDQKPLWGFVL